MGYKAPSYMPLLPSAPIGYTDPVIAKASIPLGIDAVQHALATAKFMPGTCIGINRETNALDVIKFLVPVPPSVMYMQASFIMQGDATLTMSTTETTVTKSWTNQSLANTINAPTIYSTTAGFTELSQSAIKVRSGSDVTAVPWTWTSVAVTVTFTPISGSPNAGFLYAVYFRPIFTPQVL